MPVGSIGPTRAIKWSTVAIWGVRPPPRTVSDRDEADGVEICDEGAHLLVSVADPSASGREGGDAHHCKIVPAKVDGLVDVDDAGHVADVDQNITLTQVRELDSPECTLAVHVPPYRYNSARCDPVTNRSW